jgi:2,3-diaminopropionate biosynthesis protein SbnB
VASRSILIVKSDEVDAILLNRELQLLDLVEEAYRTHGAGASSLPNSLFLRFPREERNRIIALPAYLGGEFNVAGMKWVSSFPHNLERGLNRASAVVVLNSPQTGQPLAVMEGSIISAKRTAASAAVAAKVLHGERSVGSVGFIGCGPINFEVARFLLAVWPEVERFVLFDVERSRVEQFGEKCRALSAKLKIEIVAETNALLSQAAVVSLATTAATPHIHDLSMCAPGTTVLHVSLRDIAPEVILSCDNVVDDIDHVCRAQTSVHLAEQLSGNRDFIRCTLADVLDGVAPPRTDSDSLMIFSPFGLGVLDLAVSKLVYEVSVEKNYGMVVESFLPGSYAEKF